MSFPFLFEATFEQGTNGEWTSESDTGSLLDFPHYSLLALDPASQCIPFRGAFCARVNGMGDTNDHTVTSTSITTSANANGFSRFALCVPRIAATAADVFSIFELQTATGTVMFTVGLGLWHTTGATPFVDIGVGTGATGTWTSSNSAWATPSHLLTNRWYQIEIVQNPNNAAINQATLYIDGALAATISNQNIGGGTPGIGQGVLGTQDTLSTTTGIILFDEFVQDDGRVYPLVDRYTTTLHITKSQHLFVGPGTVENSTLIAGAASDNVLSLFDTDRGNANDASKLKVRLSNINTTAGEVVDPAGMPVDFTRGCYAQLAGTNPRATIILRRAAGMSAANVKSLGERNRVRPLEVL